VAFVIITAINHGLDLAHSYGARSAGVHMSDLYGDLYAKLEPDRYGKKPGDTTKPMERWGVGMAFEEMLERGLILRVFNETSTEEVMRPGEFQTLHTKTCPRPRHLRTKGCGCVCGGGVLFTPDLLIFNGVSRIGEIKLNSMGAKGAPWKLGETYDCFDPKFDKYFCVAPEVTLLTSDLRHVSAETVKVGDRLIGFDEQANGTHRHLRHTTVEAVKRISKPCSRLWLADGSSIVCSDDHMWYGTTSPNRREEWLSTSEVLRSDARLKGGPGGRKRTQNAHLCRVLPGQWVTKLTPEERGYLAGILDGEGCLHSSSARHASMKLTIAQKPGLVLTRIRALLAVDNVSFFETEQHGCVAIHIDKKDEILRLLSIVRPVRLLAKFVSLERLPGFSYDHVQIIRRESLGEQWVMAIQTDAHTYLAEGLASHNCQMKAYCYHIGTVYARLYSFSMREMVYFNEKDIFRGWDVQFEQWELEEEWEMLRRHGVTMKILK